MTEADAFGLLLLAGIAPDPFAEGDFPCLNDNLVEAVDHNLLSLLMEGGLPLYLLALFGLLCLAARAVLRPPPRPYPGKHTLALELLLTEEEAAPDLARLTVLSPDTQAETSLLTARTNHADPHEDAEGTDRSTWRTDSRTDQGPQHNRPANT